MVAFLRKNWFGLLSVIVSAGILLYFMLYTGGFEQLCGILGGLHKQWLIWALAAVLFSWALDTFALHILIRRLHKNQRVLSSLRITIVGMLYSALTPSSVGGQPMQVAQMASSGIKSGNAVSIISIKSVIYQTALTIYAIIAAICCMPFFLAGVPHLIIFTILGLAANLAFIGAIILMCLSEKLPGKLVRFIIGKLAAAKIVKNPGKVYAAAQRQIKTFHNSFTVMKQSPRTLIGSLLLTFMQLTSLYLAPWYIYKSFGLSGTPTYYMLGANALILMITAFIPLPGASGAAEGSFYLFFSLFLSGSMILPAIFLWRFLTYYSIILVGGVMSAALIIKPKIMANQMLNRN